jgi:hypothetical protein
LPYSDAMGLFMYVGEIGGFGGVWGGVDEDGMDGCGKGRVLIPLCLFPRGRRRHRPSEGFSFGKKKNRARARAEVFSLCPE